VENAQNHGGPAALAQERVRPHHRLNAAFEALTNSSIVPQREQLFDAVVGGDQ
jgi:hypothetical protein